MAKRLQWACAPWLAATLWPGACAACRCVGAHGAGALCSACRKRCTAHQGPRCACCDGNCPISPGDSLCPACRTRSPSYTALRAPWRYEGPLRLWLLAAKDDPAGFAWPALAQLMAADARIRILCHNATLVFVPSSQAGLQRRGYHQAARLAQSLAVLLRRPTANLLVRREHGTPQHMLNRVDRRLRAKNQWVLADNIAKVRGPLVLVDDIITTGATCSAASQTLCDAGLGPVAVVALARTPRAASWQ